MVLDNFRIDGKVAIVTGCNTGLGQGMACALAEAGADVVGINQAEPTETIARVEGIGRRFLDLRANVADIVQRAGFPAIHLSEINFEALYQQRLQQQAEQGESPSIVIPGRTQ